MLPDHDSAWVEVVYNPPLIPGGKYFLWLSEQDGWRQSTSFLARATSFSPLRAVYVVDLLESITKKDGSTTRFCRNPTARSVIRSQLGTKARRTPYAGNQP